MRWPTETLFGAIASIGESAPDRPAIVTRRRTVTYGELADQARALADSLSASGVNAGDTIAIWIENGPEWIITQLAATYLGATAVAVNTRYRRDELHHVLTDAGCRAIVTGGTVGDRHRIDVLAEVVPALAEANTPPLNSDDVPWLRTVLVTEESPHYPAAKNYREAVTTGAERNPPPPNDDNSIAACIFYTSGTTGAPKGCRQSNRALLNHSHRIGVHLGIDPEDVVFCPLPFPGVMGHNVLLCGLSHGLPVMTQRRFDAGAALELVADHGATVTSGLGTMFWRMRAHDLFDQIEVSSLRVGTVAFVEEFDEERFERIEEDLGFTIVQPYGLSEANSHAFVGNPDDPREQRKRVGGVLIYPGEQDARIVDVDTHEELPPGESGELLLRGYNVMEEYHGRPDATAEAIDDEGWLTTGDLCSRDEDGYLYFHSRLDDALQVSGYLVAPGEVERAIERLSGIEQAAVVGVDRGGEDIPIAFLRCSEDDVDVESIRTELGRRIADYKVPRLFELVRSFPRTEGPHGAKIQKHELRQRADRLLDDES